MEGAGVHKDETKACIPNGAAIVQSIRTALKQVTANTIQHQPKFQWGRYHTARPLRTTNPGYHHPTPAKRLVRGQEILSEPRQYSGRLPRVMLSQVAPHSSVGLDLYPRSNHSARVSVGQIAYCPTTENFQRSFSTNGLILQYLI